VGRVIDHRLNKAVHLMFDLRMIEVESNSAIGACGILRNIRTGDERAICFTLNRAIPSSDGYSFSHEARDELLDRISETLFHLIIKDVKDYGSFR